MGKVPMTILSRKSESHLVVRYQWFLSKGQSLQIACLSVKELWLAQPCEEATAGVSSWVH